MQVSLRIVVILVLGMMCVAGMAQPVVAQADDFPNLDLRNDWPWWRGPTRNGLGGSAATLDSLATSQIEWNSPVPGRGHGSPIIVNRRIYLLTADEPLQTHSVLAYDAVTGKEVWRKQVNQGGFPRKNHPKNTEASPTLACDGEKLFATLFHHNAVWCLALDLDGNVIWEKNIAPFQPRMFEYGYAPSPVLYKGSVIVSYEYDGPSAIVALSRDNGSQLWKAPRKQSISFSTPVVASHDGKDYLLISGQGSVAAYAPQTGELLWMTLGTTAATCGTMVWENGICFASGGYPKQETIALKIDTGEKLWANQQKSYEQSMLAVGGQLYCLTDKGILYCWDGETGAEQWKHRLAGPVSASGVVTGDNMLWSSEAGDFWLIKIDSSAYREVAKNRIGDSSFASPAIAGDGVYLRVAKIVGEQRDEFLIKLHAR